MKFRKSISFVLPLAMVLFFSCQKLDDSKLKATPGFRIMNNMMGTIQQSSDEKEVGKKVSFIDMNSNSPKVLYESGLTSPLQIVYNSNETLTLQIVAKDTGSTDTFIIDKTTGKFARAAAGSVMGVYATASLGILK